MKYKLGQKVRIKATNEEGVVKKILDETYTGDYYVSLDGKEYSYREAELCDPAPVKVGDIIQAVHTSNAKRKRIIDVLENTAIDHLGEIYTFDELGLYKIEHQDTCPHCGQVKNKII